MKKEILKWIFIKDSWVKWNATTIMVWVHWNETSWIDALNDIIDDLKIISWKVFFIYANLKAIEKNVRFTEKNLNRCFLKELANESYEERRAKEIMSILDKSDFLLDVHNTISFNSSLEILITSNTDFIKYFPLSKVITHIDEIQKWGSDWYLDSVWWKWFCIECGSINFWDKNKSKDLAKKSIINFLKVTWNISWKAEEYSWKRKIMRMDYVYKTKTDNFKLKREFKDFEELKSWEIIWYDWSKEIITDKESIIMFAHNREEKWSEWFYLWYKSE